MQIIDDYLGRLGITFGFIQDDADCGNSADCDHSAGRDNSAGCVDNAHERESTGFKVGIQMVKTAEDFLNEYSGFAAGHTCC